MTLIGSVGVGDGTGVLGSRVSSHRTSSAAFASYSPCCDADMNLRSSFWTQTAMCSQSFTCLPTSDTFSTPTSLGW
jgi:hypothetical protein